MSIQGTTEVFGIIGDPVAHSLSPVMQNAAFRAAGLNAVYVPFPVRSGDLASAVAGLRALGIRGANVTIPHKEAICPFLDEVDPEARQIGAVNTLVCHDGKLTGYNTDAPGFLRALSEEFDFDPKGRRILLLGAGGACRAALAALAGAGAAWLGIANRTSGRAEALAVNFLMKYSGTAFAPVALCPSGLTPFLPEVDLVVNTSSVGLKGESFENFPWERLNRRAMVYDMVYAVAGTPLALAARDRGHRAADGLGMLAGQGEEAFFLWTGRRPPSGVMKARLLAELAGK